MSSPPRFDSSTADLVKRALDVSASLAGLVLAFPVLLPVALLIRRQDGGSPFYVAPRVGRNDHDFQMVKLRSMVLNAHTTSWDSTRADDHRITTIGHRIRHYKIDELPQLWNVLRGEMSLVGPRPNVRSETSIYTPFERRLLEVKPGITDFASIVFSDLGEILRGTPDPNIAYRNLVRPAKSQLGVFYVEHRSLLVDVALIFITLASLLSRRWALSATQWLLRRLGASDNLVEIAGRNRPLNVAAPPVDTNATADSHDAS